MNEPGMTRISRTNAGTQPNSVMRAISFVYRFIVLLFVVAFLEGNRDA